MYFISSLFEKGCSPATINSYCSGISFFHKINGLADPTNKFIVHKILGGCCRSRTQTDTRAPISLELLTKICQTLSEICFNQYETFLFKAVFTLAYFGLLRVSELVFTGPMHADRPLQYDDVSYALSSKILFVQIRKSKTNQVGKATKLKIYPAEKGAVCYVEPVLNFMKVRPNITCKGYLFCHANREPLTRYQFASILSKSISKLGLPTTIFKTHSFRIGRSTDLATKGMHQTLYRKWGDGIPTLFTNI